MAAERSLGHYRLERVLGTGTFATVWLAHDRVIDRMVAIKVLADNWSRDLDVRRRFLSEARVLLSAESPRITRGFELGETDDERPYLVMTWADRCTLAERIADRRRQLSMFTAEEAASIVREVALALADVHQLGHLHRDVKPSNVLIRSGAAGAPVAGIAPDEQLLIGDFGLARGLDASAITLVAGSPGYVAPEQAAGLTQLDRTSDLYPLGRILLELLTGDSGGRATTMAAAATERIDVPELFAEHRVPAPQQLLVLLEQLLSVDPAGRPPTAHDVAAQLEPFSTVRDDGGMPSPRAVPAVPVTSGVSGGPDGDARRRSVVSRRTVVPAAIVAVSVSAGLVLLATRDGESPGTTPGSTTAAPTDAVETDSTSSPTAESLRALPLPEGSRVLEGSDDSHTRANVNSEVDGVVQFFMSPPAPWKVLDGPTAIEGRQVVELTDGSRTATVTVTVDAASAGPGVSLVVIDYDD